MSIFGVMKVQISAHYAFERKSGKVDLSLFLIPLKIPFFLFFLISYFIMKVRAKIVEVKNTGPEMICNFSQISMIGPNHWGSCGLSI